MTGPVPGSTLVVLRARVPDLRQMPGPVAGAAVVAAIAGVPVIAGAAVVATVAVVVGVAVVAAVVGAGVGAGARVVARPTMMVRRGPMRGRRWVSDPRGILSLGATMSARATS